jgi:hypothetical protein
MLLRCKYTASWATAARPLHGAGVLLQHLTLKRNPEKLTERNTDLGASEIDGTKLTVYRTHNMATGLMSRFGSRNASCEWSILAYHDMGMRRCSLRLLDHEQANVLYRAPWIPERESWLTWLYFWIREMTPEMLVA